VAWESAEDGGVPEASVLRELVSVNGRPPRPKDKPGCLDPKPVSPEPLAMLLPARQPDYAFTFAGRTRIDGREVTMIDYRSLIKAPAEVTRREDCVSIELPGRSRGRVWVDQTTGEVLRLDEHLVGIFEFRVPDEPRRPAASSTMTLERADTSIRYRPVRFADPDETLMLPASVESFTIIRNAGTPRVRKTQQFSDYRRFVTAGRVLPQ
jgi:hypothetical protein